MSTPEPVKRLRLAVLSDVHGNVWALESVLADAERRHLAAFVFLGDLLADGPDPVGTLTMLRTLSNGTYAQGNTDRYLAGLDKVVSPRSELPDLIATWQWAVDQLGAGGCRFLAGLPTGVTLETPAGRLLATHGVPGNDEGFIDPTRSDTWTDLDWHGARLLLVGHTHRPFVLETGDGLIVNPGSVGITRLTDWRATYAVLDLFAEHRSPSSTYRSPGTSRLTLQLSRTESR